jgi:hypothetical protein
MHKKRYCGCRWAKTPCLRPRNQSFLLPRLEAWLVCFANRFGRTRVNWQFSFEGLEYWINKIFNIFARDTVCIMENDLVEIWILILLRLNIHFSNKGSDTNIFVQSMIYIYNVVSLLHYIWNHAGSECGWKSCINIDWKMLPYCCFVSFDYMRGIECVYSCL